MEKLTPEEDAELRRLSALARFGDLSDQAATLKAELRSRDRRKEVREPADLVVPHPRSASDGPLVTMER